MPKFYFVAICPLLFSACTSDSGALADDTLRATDSSGGVAQETGSQEIGPQKTGPQKTGAEAASSTGAEEAGATKQAEPPSEMVEGEPMYTVLPLDAIPAIDKPVFVDVMEAMSFMADDEPVLGVVGVKGTAKCYSAWLLDGHEVVNDELDGIAIAATW